MNFSFFDRLLAARLRHSKPLPGNEVPPQLLEPIPLEGGPQAPAELPPGATLPPHIVAEVDRLAARGNAMMDAAAYVEALAAFREGLEILPQPRHRWGAAEWFLVGMGDALWFLGLHLNALPVWRDVLLYCGLGNPFPHLRRGQTLYELGEFKEAENELMRALLLGGEPLFAEEPRKYWEYITSRARPPAGWTSWEGWTGVEPGSPLHEWLLDPGIYELRADPQN
jgi:tetratricopeptide (TPR) repeat protein